VAREADFGTGGAEVVHAGREVRGADAVVKGNAPRRPPSQPAAVAALAEQLAHPGQEGRLTDAAGHQPDVFDAGEIGEAVAQRPPRSAGRSRGNSAVSLPTTR